HHRYWVVYITTVHRQGTDDDRHCRHGWPRRTPPEEMAATHGDNCCWPLRWPSSMRSALHTTVMSCIMHEYGVVANSIVANVNRLCARLFCDAAGLHGVVGDDRRWWCRFCWPMP
ncbi:hypothetical protein Dimus_010759, partial [Dionaea muscipula]